MSKNRAGKLLVGLCATLLTVALLWSASKFIMANSTPKKITIICSDDTLGNLQPCGCNKKSEGGLLRRATYIKSVIAENPNCVIVDSGDLAYAITPSKPTAQLEVVAKAMKMMGYAATGVGPVDVLLEDGYYKTLKDVGIPVVHVDTKEHDGIQPYIIKDVAGVKVGIVSFGAVPADRAKSPDVQKLRLSAFKEAREKSDILILLDQGNMATDDWLEQNADKVGAPDIVLGGPTRMSLTQVKQIGKTMVVPTSTQANIIARVDVVLNGEDKIMTYSKTEMDASVADDPKIKELLKVYNDEQAKLAKNPPSVNVSVSPQPVQAYYSSQVCAVCHKSEYEQWKTTPHSKAISTLDKSQRPIPECLECHSEEYRQTKRMPTDSGLQTGVECSSCHANVLPHNETYKKKNDTEAIKASCVQCHNKLRSPDFDMNKYYDRVKHKKQR